MSNESESDSAKQSRIRWHNSIKIGSAVATAIGCIAALAQVYQYLVEGKINLVLSAICTLLGAIGVAGFFVVKNRGAALIGAIAMLIIIGALFSTVHMR